MQRGFNWKLLLTLALLLSACTSSGGISVVDAWARPAAAGTNSAAYFQLYNGSDARDALLSAETEVARAVEVHQSMVVDMEGDEMDGMIASSGMEMGMEAMQMVPQERIDIVAGETVIFSPGGLHVMIIDLAQDLAVGDEIELILNFESGLRLLLSVEIKEQ